MLVQFGIYDAFGFLSIDTYKRALQEIVDSAKNYRSDLILFGPPMVNYGGGAMEWGIERPYASAAKEVALANGCSSSTWAASLALRRRGRPRHPSGGGDGDHRRQAGAALLLRS